tara:strand:+ start:2076 stop:2696 length:621 start_codon:yes stop_codon:yes gene_type:complete
MASKKAGRLAGLATLAGLAYMANEKNKDKAETKSDAKDTPAPDRDDSERVIGSRVRKDDDITVAGEGGFDTPADMSSSPRVGTPARTASSVKAPMIGGPTPARDPGGAGKRGAVSPGPNPARAPGGVGKRGGVGDGGQSMVERQNAGAKRAGLSVDDYLTSGKKTIDEQDGTFKRGGKVKKMASGGMASKRGDGIASKGKTRCKMY